MPRSSVTAKFWILAFIIAIQLDFVRHVIAVEDALKLCNSLCTPRMKRIQTDASIVKKILEHEHTASDIDAIHKHEQCNKKIEEQLAIIRRNKPNDFIQITSNNLKSLLILPETVGTQLPLVNFRYSQFAKVVRDAEGDNSSVTVNNEVGAMIIENSERMSFTLNREGFAEYHNGIYEWDHIVNILSNMQIAADGHIIKVFEYLLSESETLESKEKLALNTSVRFLKYLKRKDISKISEETFRRIEPYLKPKAAFDLTLAVQKCMFMMAGLETLNKVNAALAEQIERQMEELEIRFKAGNEKRKSAIDDYHRILEEIELELKWRCYVIHGHEKYGVPVEIANALVTFDQSLDTIDMTKEEIIELRSKKHNTFMHNAYAGATTNTIFDHIQNFVLPQCENIDAKDEKYQTKIFILLRRCSFTTFPHSVSAKNSGTLSSSLKKLYQTLVDKGDSYQPYPDFIRIFNTVFFFYYDPNRYPRDGFAVASKANSIQSKLYGMDSCVKIVQNWNEISRKIKFQANCEADKTFFKVLPAANMSLKFDLKMDICTQPEIYDIRDNWLGTYMVRMAYVDPEMKKIAFNEKCLGKSLYINLPKEYKIPNEMKKKSVSFEDYQRYFLHRFGLLQNDMDNFVMPNCDMLVALKLDARHTARVISRDQAFNVVRTLEYTQIMRKIVKIIAVSDSKAVLNAAGLYKEILQLEKDLAVEGVDMQIIAYRFMHFLDRISIYRGPNEIYHIPNNRTYRGALSQVADAVKAYMLAKPDWNRSPVLMRIIQYWEIIIDVNNLLSSEPSEG